ncbi:MAG: SGNH/GDSL hydrolase family protein [Ktedonobacterales bacterium]
MQTAAGTGSRVLLYSLFAVVLVVLLVGMDVLLFSVSNPTQRQHHHYYLALGDSISFGYQPDVNFSDGFVDDVFANLQKSGVTDLTNYACGGENSTTMIEGNCADHLIKHNAYAGPQLDAALAFIQAHRGAVSPVTLDIGANDVLPDFNSTTCTASPQSAADLTTLDTNLTKTILPRLLGTLTEPGGPATSSLVLLNYYNPYAKMCPNSVAFVHLLNDHLAADAAQFKVPLVDVYAAFGGDAQMAAHVCQYTWVCDAQFNDDFHPTSTGYQVIATAVERTLGYPGSGPSLLNPFGANNPPIQTGPSGLLPITGPWRGGV